MKHVLLLILLFSFSLALNAQKATPKTAQKSTAQKKSTSSAKTGSAKVAINKPKPKAVKPKPEPTPIDPAVEKERFDKALAETSAGEKASALKKFLVDFPESERKIQAQESLASSRAALADETLRAGDATAAITIFRLVVEDAPTPVSEKLYNEIISKFPANLFWAGQRAASLEIATAIEKKIAGNSSQLLTLANFYLGIENGADAKRIAEAVIALEPESALPHQTLAMAHRLNFDLEESAKSYARALELDPESEAVKRNLAEMKRALGNTDEAEALYREILAKYEADVPTRTGLILTLFDAGKIAEAETEMAKVLEQNPGNISLLAGAAYTYAANGKGDKAVEYARKAIEKEPRYVWSHIALARGLMLQGKPVDAERTLIAARQYGNFPTLEYEIASARFAAGFFREAADELKKSFIVKDGVVQAKLGGRISRQAESFSDLISAERKASIFEPAAADNSDNATRLKLLLDLNQKIAETSPNEEEIATLSNQFVKGDDKMAFHRKLFVASLLLDKKIALQTVLELTKSATGNSDAAFEAPNAAAAVMAEELYDSRQIAFARNEFLLVPDVPRQTLSAIVRGRIEELSGWALYHQNNIPDAVIRLRRAISVLPENSAWWRSAKWRLGSALEADGKNEEALAAYIESYKTDKPSVVKYITLESLYKKVNGNTEGLEAKVGPNPLRNFAGAKPAEPVAQPVETKIAAPAAVEQSAPTPESVEPKKETITTSTDVPTSVPAESQTTETPAQSPPVTTEPEPPKAEPQKSESEKEADTEPAKAVQAMPTPEAMKEKVESTVTTPPTESQLENKTQETEKTPAEPEKAPEPEIKPASLEKEKPVEPDRVPSEATQKPPDLETANNPPAKKPDPTKPLFEPIIITIPKNDPVKLSSKTEEKPEPAKPAEPIDESVKSGAARLRVVVDGRPVDTDTCGIELSQDSVSIINGGGSVGVLLRLIGDIEISEVQVTASSAEDIEVKLEPDIIGISGRRFYVIKSVSERIGSYWVRFESKCGSKEVSVKVR